MRKELIQPLDEVIKEYEAQAPYKMPEEVALQHPTQDCGVHLRDDGTLELYAGNARILLCANTGSIIIMGKDIINFSTGIDNLLTGGSGFTFNGSLLNKWWYENHGPATYPLTSTVLDELKFITGAPGEGQRPMALSEVLGAAPIFTPQTKSKMSLLSRLDKVLGK